MKRIGLCGCLLAGVAMAQYPAPHAGWKLVPGGEDLVDKGYWGSVQYWYGSSAGTTESVSNGTMTAFASGGYFGFFAPVGPWLANTTGNFGVTAVLQTGPSIDGTITLTGSMATGSQYWQGLQQVDFGVDSSGNYFLYYWNGVSSSPVSYQALKSGSGSPPVGQVTVEFLRQNGQFMLYFNGTQYGPFPDPGLFTTGYVLPGFQAGPNQTIKLSQFAFEVPAVDTTSQIVEPVGAVSVSDTPPTLGSLAAVTGRSFGMGVDSPELAEGIFNAYTAAPNGAPNVGLQSKAIGQFGVLGNYTMYPDTMQPTQGDFEFDTNDAFVATAKATGRYPILCHALIGGDNKYQPDWITDGNFTSAQLTQILVTEIQTVMAHYKGDCETWVVVNEALDSNGNLRTDNIWEQTMGTGWVDLAFQTARLADPSAKLYLGDYGAENSGTKAAGMYNFVASIVARGIPIDGIAMQCHWVENPSSLYSPNLQQIETNMAQYAGLRLLVRETELDVALALPASSTDLTTEATAFSTSVQACLASPNCVGINVFGADDTISWISNAFPGEGDATMFDDNFDPKPAYTAVKSALSAAPPAKSTIERVDTASGGLEIAQNTFIEIKGYNLVPANTPAAGVIWSTAPSFAQNMMPTQLGNVSVTVNGKLAFVYFYCSVVTSSVCTMDQINVLTPLDNATGPVQVVVTNGSTATAAFTATMEAVDPTFLLFNPLGPIVATHADYTLVGSAVLYPGYSTPAQPGETVLTYGIGWGLPTNSLVNGSSLQSGSLPSVPVCQIGGAPAAVAAALISPGLYQLNLTVPQDAKDGDNAVSCTYAGATTPTGAFITVQ